MTRTRQSLILLALTLALPSPTFPQVEPRIRDELTEALAIAKSFADTLKPELKNALETGGPIAAVETCAQRAPEIASQLAKETGWTIRRVSLQPRNPNASPDEWESDTLRALVERRANASDGGAESLVAWESEPDRFRFMKAQLVEPLCAVCHGKEIAPDLERTLLRIYPSDSATGYDLGEIRGAISLIKQRGI